MPPRCTRRWPALAALAALAAPAAAQTAIQSLPDRPVVQIATVRYPRDLALRASGDSARIAADLRGVLQPGAADARYLVVAAAGPVRVFTVAAGASEQRLAGVAGQAALVIIAAAADAHAPTVDHDLRDLRDALRERYPGGVSLDITHLAVPDGPATQTPPPTRAPEVAGPLPPPPPLTGVAWPAVALGALVLALAALLLALPSPFSRKRPAPKPPA